MHHRNTARQANKTTNNTNIYTQLCTFSLLLIYHGLGTQIGANLFRIAAMTSRNRRQNGLSPGVSPRMLQRTSPSSGSVKDRLRKSSRRLGRHTRVPELLSPVLVRNHRPEVAPVLKRHEDMASVVRADDADVRHVAAAVLVVAHVECYHVHVVQVRRDLLH